MRPALAVLAVFLALFLVPIAVYGAGSALTGLPVPGGDAAAFLGGVAVAKLGTAIAFVGIWMLGRGAFGGRWLAYAALWWVMFALGEAGQALGPGYGAQEAALGLLSETIYLPLAAFATFRLLRL